MTDDEMQRMMEFIIKQQESLSDRMEQIVELHAQAESRISRLETATVNLYNTVTEVGKAQKDLTVKMAEMAEAQAHTDQRLNVIIDIIEQGRNGKSQS